MPLRAALDRDVLCGICLLLFPTLRPAGIISGTCKASSSEPARLRSALPKGDFLLEEP